MYHLQRTADDDDHEAVELLKKTAQQTARIKIAGGDSGKFLAVIFCSTGAFCNGWEPWSELYPTRSWQNVMPVIILQRTLAEQHRVAEVRGGGDDAKKVSQEVLYRRDARAAHVIPPWHNPLPYFFLPASSISIIIIIVAIMALLLVRKFSGVDVEVQS